MRLPRSAAAAAVLALSAALTLAPAPGRAQVPPPVITVPPPEPTTTVTTTTVPDTLPPPTTTTVPPASPSSEPGPGPGPTTTTPGAPATTGPTTTTVLAGPPSPRLPAGGPSSLAPVCGVPSGGAGCRVIAYYGNPLSKQMGILGRLPFEQMLPSLLARTEEWRKADPTTPTRCALELIAITAQASPTASGLYRARMPAALIDKVLGWARQGRCLLILDIHVGWSNVAAELPYLKPWLTLPDVHLALDPEWDMPQGVAPGKQIGTMSAADVNVAVDFLTQIVSEQKLPPKLLVVHRFVKSMVTEPETIRTSNQIRLLVNMDGFGSPERKLNSYRVAMAGMPTTLTGYKLFTLIDTPMLGPADVLKLNPVPVFLNYQ